MPRRPLNPLTENLDEPEDEVLDSPDTESFADDLGDDPAPDPTLLVDAPEDAAAAAKGALVDILKADPDQGVNLILALLSAGGARTVAKTSDGKRANYIDRNGEPVDWDNAPPGTEAYATSRNAFPDRMLWPEKKPYTREYQEETADGWEFITNRDPQLTPVIWNGVRYDLPLGRKVKVPSGVAQIYQNAIDEQIAFENCETLYTPEYVDILRNNGRGTKSLRLPAAGGFDQYEVYHTVKTAGGYVPPEIDRILRRKPRSDVPDANARPAVSG